MMGLNIFKNTVLIFLLILISCGSNDRKKSAQNNEMLRQSRLLSGQHDINNSIGNTIVVGANQIELYLQFLKNKKVGIIANQTSVIFKVNDKQIATTSSKSRNDNYTHLVDSLLLLNINVKKVFSPEHGFRGTADAGEKVKDGFDTKTGLPIVSLYGKNRKPF